MKKGLTIALAICVLHTASAQDFHFAQTAQTPLLINPGAVGVFDGWERISINHRTQWVATGTQFLTTSIAADANLWKSRRKNRAHAGIGVMFFNDIGGDSKFGNQAGSLTISGIIPAGPTSTISAGIQGGFGQRKADLSGVSFMNQWDGEEFNATILSGEQNTLTSFTYIDASAGLYYVYNGKKSSFARNRQFKFRIGAAGYHLNSPKLKYVNGTSDRLYRKLVAHASISGDIPDSKFAIDASVVQFIQGGHFESIFGTTVRYRFEEGTKITGSKQSAYCGFGVYMRLNDAIIPTVLLDWGGFQFVLSYDITISDLRRAYSGGSLEFSMSYTNRDHALFKTRKR